MTRDEPSVVRVERSAIFLELDQSYGFDCDLEFSVLFQTSLMPLEIVRTLLDFPNITSNQSQKFLNSLLPYRFR